MHSRGGSSLWVWSLLPDSILVSTAPRIDFHLKIEVKVEKVNS